LSSFSPVRLVEGKNMSSGDLWFVKLPNGDVHHVTLDQLDAAFQAGHINENTPVLSEGATQWTTLGAAAGLDEAPPPAAPSPTPAPVVRSVAPPAVHAAAPVPYVPQVAPVSYAPRSAPVSYAPRSAPVSYAPPGNSIRPVAMDLGADFDLNDAPFKSKSRKGWIVAIMALAAVGGGVGFAATNGKIALGESPLVAAAPPPAPAPPPVDPLPAVKPQPAPQAPPVVQAPLAGTLPAMDSPMNPHFAQASKDRQAQADTHQDGARARHSYTAQTSTKKSSVFTKGGNKFDPLNSDL
jgi:hypothetical protein